MSRLLNIDPPQANVERQCAKRLVSVSAMEPFPGGGTHLVCVRPEGTEETPQLFPGNLIAGLIERYPFYRPQVP